MIKDIKEFKNKIIQGDCFEIMKDIPDNTIDMIFCDLPYGISRNSGYTNNSIDKIDYIKKYGNHSINFGDWDNKNIDLKKLSKEYHRILKFSGVVVLFYDIWATDIMKKAFEQFKQPRILCWSKNNPVPINSKINFLSNATEYMFSFVKSKKPIFNATYHNGIFQYPLCHGKERTKHPTQKPLKLIIDIIQIYTNKDMIILDNCLGSGTTAVACKYTGRNYIGIEINKEYCEIAQKRITNVPKSLNDFLKKSI